MRDRLSSSSIPQWTRQHGTLTTLVGGMLLGLLLGLAIAWSWPAGRTDATPQDLRPDFQSDYILWIAERYATAGDADWAREKLGAKPSPQRSGPAPESRINQR
jgi:hypothetical protein